MNHVDFLKQFIEIDDDLLLKAEQPLTRKSHSRRMITNIVAAILALCLLSITVAAVTINVRIFTSADMILNYEDYYLGFPPLSSKVTTIEYELYPQDIKIPLHWKEELTDAWKGFGYTYDHFTGIDLKDSNGKRVDFGGIAQIEQLLCFRLASSEELRQVTQSAYVTLVVTDQDRAAEQIRSEGILSPDGLVIYLPFSRNAEAGLDPELVDYCGLSIFVPLTESFAGEYASHSVLSGVYKQDLTQTSLLSDGGIEIIMLGNTAHNGDALNGFAAWEYEGLGYLVEMRTNRNVEINPRDVLMPYLEHLEG